MRAAQKQGIVVDDASLSGMEEIPGMGVAARC